MVISTEKERKKIEARLYFCHTSKIVANVNTSPVSIFLNKFSNVIEKRYV